MKQPEGKGFGTTVMQDSGSTNYTTSTGLKATKVDETVSNDFITGFIKPKQGIYADSGTSDVNPKNVYAIKLEFRVISPYFNPGSFEINDVSVVYRDKTVKAKM